MMKLIVLVAFTASFTVARAQVCPQGDVDYRGGDFKLNLDVATWKDCAQSCSTEAKCTAFTYVQKTKCCYLKSGDARGVEWSNKVAAPGMISGPKTCTVPKCEEVNVDYRGSNLVQKEGVESWEDCAKLCDTTQGCLFWTWVNDKYTQNPLVRKKCFMKSSKSGSMAWDNVVSGSAACRKFI